MKTGCMNRGWGRVELSFWLLMQHLRFHSRRRSGDFAVASGKSNDRSYDFGSSHTSGIIAVCRSIRWLFFDVNDKLNDVARTIKQSSPCVSGACTDLIVMITRKIGMSPFIALYKNHLTNHSFCSRGKIWYYSHMYLWWLFRLVSASNSVVTWNFSFCLSLSLLFFLWLILIHTTRPKCYKIFLLLDSWSDQLCRINNICLRGVHIIKLISK